MDTFSQIALNFVEETPPRQDVPPSREDQPVSIGIRIKKLKQPDTGKPADTAKQGKDAPALLKPKSGRGRKSIRQIAEEADLIRIPDDEQLFSKQYYTMGEVSEMFRVNQSLLRFWEAEFSILQPRKNKKGDRYFRPVDIKNLHLIYHLLRQRKYTIEGAKDFLRKNKKAEEKFETIKKLGQIREFLLEMKAGLR
jgi:DNA-binding transcriptional MerR regulator